MSTEFSKSPTASRSCSFVCLFTVCVMFIVLGGDVFHRFIDENRKLLNKVHVYNYDVTVCPRG